MPAKTSKTVVRSYESNPIKKIFKKIDLRKALAHRVNVLVKQYSISTETHALRKQGCRRSEASSSLRKDIRSNKKYSKIAHNFHKPITKSTITRLA